MTDNISIEDRFVLQDLVTSYCFAVDKLGDVDGLVSLFTEDAICDLSPIGLPSISGHQEIRAFYEGVFEMMTHHAHYMANFAVQRLEGDEAAIRCYVMGMGNAGDGSSVLVYVDYEIDCRRTAQGWKISKFYEKPLMPLPAVLGQLHEA